MHSSHLLVFGLLYGKKLNLKRNLLHIPDFLGHATIHDNSYVGKRLHSARKVLSIIGSLGSRLGFTVYVKAAGPIVLRQFLQRFSSSCLLWFDARYFDTHTGRPDRAKIPSMILYSYLIFVKRGEGQGVPPHSNYS